MDANRSKRSDREIAEAFDQLFETIPEPESKEDIHAFLTESGYDPEAVRTKGAEFVENLMAGNWRFVAADELHSAGAGIDEIPLRSDWGRERLADAIRKVASALSSGGREPSLAFRNLDELTDGDLATILQQMEYKARSQGISIE